MATPAAGKLWPSAAELLRSGRRKQGHSSIKCVPKPPPSKLGLSPKKRRGTNVGGSGMANLEFAPLLCHGDTTQVLPFPQAQHTPGNKHSSTHCCPQECMQPTHKGAYSAVGKAAVTKEAH